MPGSGPRRAEPALLRRRAARTLPSPSRRAAAMELRRGFAGSLPGVFSATRSRLATHHRRRGELAPAPPSAPPSLVSLTASLSPAGAHRRRGVKLVVPSRSRHFRTGSGEPPPGSIHPRRSPSLSGRRRALRPRREPGAPSPPWIGNQSPDLLPPLTAPAWASPPAQCSAPRPSAASACPLSARQRAPCQAAPATGPGPWVRHPHPSAPSPLCLLGCPVSARCMFFFLLQFCLLS